MPFLRVGSAIKQKAETRLLPVAIHGREPKRGTEQLLKIVELLNSTPGGRFAMRPIGVLMDVEFSEGRLLDTVRRHALEAPGPPGDFRGDLPQQPTGRQRHPLRPPRVSREPDCRREKMHP